MRRRKVRAAPASAPSTCTIASRQPKKAFSNGRICDGKARPWPVWPPCCAALLRRQCLRPGPRTEKTSFALLDGFLDAGFDFIDTADSYSSWVPGHAGGESETIIGNWLKARNARSRVVIATKVGMWSRQPGLKAANIIAGCEGSLQRLGTDHIDLYQSHKDDKETPQDEDPGSL